MVYCKCGDAGVRESEPYDPQGDRQKAARYDAIQRNLWGNDNLPPRDRPGEVRVLSHVTKPRSPEQKCYRSAQVSAVVSDCGNAAVLYAFR
jgi:hypothetical protein